MTYITYIYIIDFDQVELGSVKLSKYTTLQHKVRVCFHFATCFVYNTQGYCVKGFKKVECQLFFLNIT